VGADLLVFAAPMRMGFVASLLKRANDRMIPLVLPYVDVVDGECHHPMRYKPFDLALVVERGDASAEEVTATVQIYRRLAKNMAGKLAWSKVVEPTHAEGLVPAGDAGEGQGHALGAH
jgi:multimeric flavodoxin WrbA